MLQNNVFFSQTNDEIIIISFDPILASWLSKKKKNSSTTAEALQLCSNIEFSPRITVKIHWLAAGKLDPRCWCTALLMTSGLPPAVSHR